MKKLFFPLVMLFSLLFYLILFSCIKEDNITTGKEDLVPLKTGNYWTYEVYRSETLYDTICTIVGNYATIKGYNGFLYSPRNNQYHVTYLIDNDANGNYIVVGGYSDNDTLISPSILYKNNAIEGESWDSKVIYYNDIGIFYQANIKVYCMKTNEIVNTSKGEFKCMVFRYSPNSGNDVFFIYISKGIGIVKSEHFESNDLFSSETLIDYEADN